MRTYKNMFTKIKVPFHWYLQTTWKKKVASTLGVLIALLIITTPLRPHKNQYTTEPVTRDTVTDIVSESGNVNSSGRFDVYSPTTGYIQAVYVSNGDTVNPGDNLFQVKSTATIQDQATAYTNYQNAVSTEKTAEENKLSSQALLEKDRQAILDAQNAEDYKNNNTTNPATKTTYTDLEKQSIDSALQTAKDTFTADEKKYNGSDTAIAAAQASVNSTWLAYQATQDMVATAPAPGTIANFSLAIGDKVSANPGTVLPTSTTSPTSPALVILDGVSRSSIKIPLNEVDVDKVKIGQPATIVFDAFHDRTYKGHITSIDTAGTNTNGVITYNSLVTIDNPDANIRTEMTATVSIETAKHKNVLTVPNSAVKPYRGSKAVIVMGASKKNPVVNKAGKVLPLHYVPITIGLKGISRTEIIRGVVAGTPVVTSSID